VVFNWVLKLLNCEPNFRHVKLINWYFFNYLGMKFIKWLRNYLIGNLIY
jgi:hypothetical protein